MSDNDLPGLALLSLGKWETHSALTQIHVVEDILEQYEFENDLESGSLKVSDVFDLIIGTGTRGHVSRLLLVACMLGPLRMSPEDAKKAYLQLFDSNFLAKNELSERAEILKGALKDLLDSQTADTGSVLSATKMVDVGKIIPQCKFAMTAMTAANLSKSVVLRAYRGRSSPIKCTLLEALHATLADLQVLPAIPIGVGSESFIAATAKHCNPLEAILEETSSIFKSRIISVIVSVGSGRPNSVSLDGHENTGLDVADSSHTVSQSIESQFSGQANFVVRFDVDGFDISDAVQPGDLISHSRAYLARKEIHAQMDELVDSLKSRPKRLEARPMSGLSASQGVSCPITDPTEPAIANTSDLGVAGKNLGNLESATALSAAPFGSAVVKNAQPRSYIPVQNILPSPFLPQIELKGRLEQILRRKEERSSANAIYMQVVLAALCSNDENDARRWTVLHVIVCAEEPLTADLVVILSGVDLHLVTAVVQSLYPVVLTDDKDGSIHTCHPSFHDFIVECIDREFLYHPPSVHFSLAQICIKEMAKSLRFNICSLESSFTLDSDLKPPLEDRASQHIGELLAYACRKWWFHTLRCDGEAKATILPTIACLLQEKGVFWIETMSLLDDLESCKKILEEIVSSSIIILMAPVVHMMVSEAAKLVQLFNMIPEKITPHLYLSCLALSEDTPALRCWRDQFPCLSQALSQQQQENQLFGPPPVEATVCPVAFSPDGKYVVSGSHSNIIRVWNTNPGKQIRKIEGHTSPVRSVAFAPDGRRTVSGSDDQTIRIWDTESGKELQRLDGHTCSVLSTAFSPDGMRIISGSEDKTIRIWDVDSGKELQKLTGHTCLVSSVDVSPDGKRVVSGSFDKTIRIWDTVSGQEPRKFEASISYAYSVAFSADGKQVISGSSDNAVRIWDALSGKELRKLEEHKCYVSSVACSLDGRHIVSGSGDRTINIWDVKSGKVLRTIDSRKHPVSTVAFSANGTYIATGSHDDTVQIWETEPNTQPQTLRGHTSFVSTVAFSPDGKHIVSESQDQTLRIWDAESHRELQTIYDYPFSAHSVAFSPDGKRIASGSTNRIVHVWDTESGIELRSLEGHGNVVLSVAFSPDGNSIVAGSDDKTIRIWDTGSGTEILKIEVHTSVPYSVSFSPDGKRIISGYDNRTIYIWDAKSGKALCRLNGHTSYVRSAIFTPDGKHVISASHDKTIRLWDAESGQELRRFDGHAPFGESVAFCPDGKYIVSRSEGNFIFVWDVESSKELRKFETRTCYGSVSFSPDGSRIISGYYDKYIGIWDLESCRQLQKIDEGSAVPDSIAFSMDVQRVMPPVPDRAIHPEVGEVVGAPHGRPSFTPLSSKSQGGLEELPQIYEILPAQEDPLESSTSRHRPSTITLSQRNTSLHLCKDGWLVTSEAATAAARKIIWIPPALRPFGPSILPVIGQEGHNRIDLSGCVFGEGWAQCYTGRPRTS
ncbi:WD40-repeat-containing domain protein [Flagelloscypha sp. PMI_526]|nr:WD40-repeat-containing domain protein [Flagelloscypha sp. PMI_526]